MTPPRYGRRTSKRFPEGQPARGGGRNPGVPPFIGKPNPKYPPQGRADSGPTGPSVTKTGTAPKPKTPTNPNKWLTDLLDSIFGPQQDYLRSAIERERESSARIAAEQQRLYAEYAKWYAGNIPSAISNTYGTAAETQSYIAKGFSDGMQIAQDAAANEANAIMGIAGAPTSGNITPGTGAADVLYGTGGYLPANTLSGQGLAFSGAAALMPGAIFAEGGKNAAKTLKEAGDRIFELQGAEAELLGKRAEFGYEAGQKRKAALDENATDLYNNGLITQREFAKRMGIKDWRKYPKTFKPGESAGVDAAASKLVGYLIDDNGDPIHDRKGNTIPVLQEPGKDKLQIVKGPDGSYIVNLTTGQRTKILGLPPTTSSKKGGYTEYKTPNGTIVRQYDDGTVEERIAPGGGGGGFDTNAMAKAADAARIARYGEPNPQTAAEKAAKLPITYKRPRITSWEAAMNYVQRQDEDITPEMAAWALWKYRRKLKGAPKKAPPNPKARAVQSGGVENASYGVSKSGYASPLPGRGSAGSWGYADPEGQDGRHMAIDWFAGAGTGVVVPEDGVVIEARYDPRRSGQIFGGTVKVRTKSGKVWVFRHTNPAQGIRMGQRVKGGTTVGRVAPWTGSTHSHVELWKTEGGGYHANNMLNPLTYLYGDRSA